MDKELRERGLERKKKGNADFKISNKRIEKINEPKINLSKAQAHTEKEKSPSKKDLQDLYKKNRRGLIGLDEEPEDRFSKALGLPKIGQEDIYKKYRENDQEVLDIMNEQSSFIQNEEGNPRRFNDREYCLDTYMGGNKIGILDFYESLSNIHWVQNMMDECLKELTDVHKPINNYNLASLEIVLLDKAISLFTDIKDQEHNNVHEYEGKAYIEDESLIGNAEIIRFLMKGLSASLNSGDPKYINPFLAGKLDLETIKFFKFPSSKGIRIRHRHARNNSSGGDTFTDPKFFTTEEMTNLIQEQANQNENQNMNEISADYFQIDTSKTRRINSIKNVFLY